MLTLARLKEVLHYDPEAGIFTWLVKLGPGRDLTGTVAGSKQNKSGHLQVCIDGKKYLLHRLAWLYVTGKWPVNWIDHENRTAGDNRFVNLREATPTQNSANKVMAKSNRSGFKGVTFKTSTSKWQARISLGSFDTPEAAHAAYMEAATKLWGEFARAA